jgi:hypothetical protein
MARLRNKTLRRYLMDIKQLNAAPACHACRRARPPLKLSYGKAQAVAGGKPDGQLAVKARAAGKKQAIKPRLGL